MNLNVWGRDVELNVVYDVYNGEDITEGQRDALKKFLSETSVLLPIAEVKAKEYCIEESGEEDISNTFKYVKPKAIYISRSVDSRIVALLCDYKLNIDDGMAIVFENEKFSEIGTEDIIL